MAKAKNSARLREILKILNKHKIVSGITPVKVRLIIEDLGPTFIKFGQIMSMRTDILPKEYCQELEYLRDNISINLSYPEVEKIIEKELNRPIGEVFRAISIDPIGSASLAQVHYAELLNGEEVVIKVQREHVKEKMEEDIMLLKKAGTILSLYPKLGTTIDFNMVLDELWNVTKEELDFRKEAANTIKFNQNNENIACVAAPKIYEDYSTEHILVMEYINGINIADIDTLKEYGYDVNEICSKFVQNYIKQIITDGFFHADPHPGNIKIKDGKIYFMDFGLVGSLTERERVQYRNGIYAFVERNTADLKNLVLAIGKIDGEIDHSKLYTDIEYMMEKYATMGLEQLDMGEVIDELLRIAKENHIRFPRGMSVLARSIVTVEGVIEKLHGSVDISALMTYYVKNDIIANVKPKEEIAKITHDVYLSSVRAVHIPSQIYNLLNLAIRGQAKLRVDASLTNDIVSKVDRWITTCIQGIIMVGFVVSGSIMASSNIKPIIYDLPLVSWVCFGCAFFDFFLLAIAFFKMLKRK